MFGRTVAVDPPPNPAESAQPGIGAYNAHLLRTFTHRLRDSVVGLAQTIVQAESIRMVNDGVDTRPVRKLGSPRITASSTPPFTGPFDQGSFSVRTLRA